MVMRHTRMLPGFLGAGLGWYGTSLRPRPVSVLRRVRHVRF
jgi:hypothetical protein